MSFNRSANFFTSPCSSSLRSELCSRIRIPNFSNASSSAARPVNWSRRKLAVGGAAGGAVCLASSQWLSWPDGGNPPRREGGGGVLQTFFSPENRNWSSVVVANLVVFGAWRACALRPTLMRLLTNNFVCSPENLRAGRFQCAVLAGLSHVTIPHLFMNVWGLEVIGRPTSTYLTGNEIFGFYFLTSLVSSLGHVLIHRTPVIGASGVLMGTVVLTAMLRPRDAYVMLFPFPGLTLTTVQLADISVLINLVGLLRSSKAFPQISWIGHLLGCGCGLTFGLYRRIVNRDERFADPLALHRRYSYLDWLLTIEDLKDTLKMLKLRAEKMQASRYHDEYRVAKLQKEIMRIDQRRKTRRRVS